MRIKITAYVASLLLLLVFLVTPAHAYDDSWHPEFVWPKGNPLLLNFLEGMENLINYSCGGSTKSKECIFEGRKKFTSAPEQFDWIFLPMCSKLASDISQHKCMFLAYDSLEKLSTNYSSNYLNSSYWSGFLYGEKPWEKCLKIKEVSKSLSCLKSNTESELESHRRDP